MITSMPLKGVFSTAKRPGFSCSTWMKGEYQDKYRRFMEDSIGLKPDFVRLFNQVDYTLFSIPHASKIITGKNGYLFSDPYIQAYLGTDFAGKYYIEKKVNKIHFLQDFLWKEKHILLIVVFAPSKAFYYPEYIPDRYLKLKKGITNYDYYVEQCQKEGINYIDYNRWLISLKNTSRFPLYPKTGIHWSLYGGFLCADSLQKYLELKMNRPLTHYVVDSMEVLKKSRGEDDDIEHTMNLIWKLPSSEFAYPRVHFRCDNSIPKPRALFVGDSFFWEMNYEDIFGHAYSKLSFWYYNQDVYPEQYSKPTLTGNISYADSILTQNVIILLQTNAGYGDLGYGWVDFAYEAFYPGPTRVKVTEAQMKTNPAWIESLKKKARDQGILLDAASRGDAIFMDNQELKKIRKKN